MHFAVMGLASYELWIITVGALACAAAGTIGCFLILRNRALMGDAISHAVLPGLAIGAWFAGSLNSWIVMLGAIIVGILTPYLIDVIQSSGRVNEDASLGIVFTVLFSIGVLIISRMSNIHLDLDCVLFGEIATIHLDPLMIGKRPWGPKAFWTLSGTLLVNVLFIVLFYKELKLSTFDEGLATAMGLRPKVIHYALLALVALTTIAVFESVGVVIVVAMLIAPGAIAYLLTDRLSVMIFLAGCVGVACSALGYGMSMTLGGKVSIAGCIATMAGVLFALTFLFSPRYGYLFQAWRRAQLSRRLSREHLLMVLYRAHEKDQDWVAEKEAFGVEFGHGHIVRKTASRLLRAGSILWENKKLRLTPSGLQQAEPLVRAHRLWESYSERHLGLPPDHVHRSADDIEHFLTPELQEELRTTLEHPERDPHGQKIP